MDIRYSTNPKDFKTYTTEDIRREFLIETLFRPDEVIATYSHVDRMVAVAACRSTNRSHRQGHRLLGKLRYSLFLGTP